MKQRAKDADFGNSVEPWTTGDVSQQKFPALRSRLPYRLKVLYGLDQ